jgi:hypothetical protein
MPEVLVFRIGFKIYLQLWFVVGNEWGKERIVVAGGLLSFT